MKQATNSIMGIFITRNANKPTSTEAISIGPKTAEVNTSFCLENVTDILTTLVSLTLP